MGTVTIILILFGLLVACVGGIMTLVAAFQESVGWGVACLLFSPTQLVFTFMHWARAKYGFLTSMAGTVLMVAGVVASPDVRAQLANFTPAKFDPAKFTAASTPAPKQETVASLTSDIQQQRDHIEAMETKYAEDGVVLAQLNKTLTERRATLKPDDQEAINQFNQEAADYKARNTARPQSAGEIASAKADLDKLLAKRALIQAGKAPGAASAKTVVMYTTATCPACKAAKAYMAQKGVHYEEHDVNTSPEAREAFLKLGGHGVPLILIGSEKMEGFDPGRLSKLL